MAKAAGNSYFLHLRQGAPLLDSTATRFNPAPMAEPAVCRQAPEVGAGWFSDHVRI